MLYADGPPLPVGEQLRRLPQLPLLCLVSPVHVGGMRVCDARHAAALHAAGAERGGEGLFVLFSIMSASLARCQGTCDTTLHVHAARHRSLIAVNTQMCSMCDWSSQGAPSCSSQLIPMCQMPCLHHLCCLRSGGFHSTHDQRNAACTA